VEGTEFDEREFFQRIAASGARALLIGRRALVALGLPLLTADYDFWVHPEDTEAFNTSVKTLGLVASHTPEEARNRGRYVLENDEHVDVLAARTVSTPDGLVVAFEQDAAEHFSVGPRRWQSRGQNKRLLEKSLEAITRWAGYHASFIASSNTRSTRTGF